MMRTFTSLDALEACGDLILTLGNFDGVHKGHRYLIRHFKRIAGALGTKTGILSFDRNTKYETQAHSYLMTQDEKRREFDVLGIDYLWVLEFDGIKPMSYESFLFLLMSKSSLRALVLSMDLRIGKDRQGSAKRIIAFMKRHYPWVKVIIVPLLQEGNKAISSSMVRQFLRMGDVQGAHHLLGVPYSITGVVKPGNKLGRRLGYPTMNLDYPADKVKVKTGVYFTLTTVDGVSIPSLTFVGTPALCCKIEKKKELIETHLLNFSKNTYNERIRVDFLMYCRAKRSFGTMDALRKALDYDKKNGIKFFMNQGY